MAVEASAKLRLSIWRDFTPSRRLGAWDGEGKPHQVPGSDFDLQEEVYSWHLREDYLAGISDGEARRRLDDRLPLLNPSHPPSKRRLDGFVSEAERILESGDAGLSPPGLIRRR